MAWNCSLKVNGIELQACGMEANREFIGFCLWNPEIVHAIRTRDVQILEILNDCLDQWEELCGIMWSGDEVFWNIDVYTDMPEHLKNWRKRCLEAIAESDSTSEFDKQRAREILIEWYIQEQDFSLSAEDVEIDCTQINALLSHYDCATPEFYKYVENLPSASGVYLLWRDKNLEYIGHSANVRKRLGRHRIYEKNNHIIGLIPIDEKEKREVVEIVLIGALHPTQNIKWSLS